MKNCYCCRICLSFPLSTSLPPPLSPSLPPWLIDLLTTLSPFTQKNGDGFVSGSEMRMRDIVQRRRLVELAKSQAQEVALLRAEVERLRMRTFPALIQAQS